jgi:anhydro-N-acetylmuramic acid kinase
MMPHMSTQAPVTRHVVGVMTGTSIDGIDAALVRITGRDLEMQAELVGHVSHPLRNLADSLRRAAVQIPMSAGEFAQIAWMFGDLHANVIGDVLDDHNLGLDLICVHGQTVFHQPPISWQLINPAPIAARFACPVVSDLRQADLAAGGQGAPLTPIADWVLFRDPRKARAIANLGGFCNATILPRHEEQSAISELSRITI